MKYLIIDCDAVCWAIFHSLPKNLSHNDKGTAIIYGFLSQLLYFQEYHKAPYIVFTFDSKFSIRKTMFPEYKLKRDLKKEEYTDEEKEQHKDRQRQFKLLRTRVLPAIGFRNILYAQGYEGDDLIAAAVHKILKNKVSHINILSRDNDLLQLVNDKCTMYDFVSRKHWTTQSFFDEYGIYPDMWADVKAIAGCTTDEVPGVWGIGTNKAIQYLKGEMKNTSKAYQSIKASDDIIKFTRKLTTIPLDGVPEPTFQEDVCTIKNMKEVAREYNMNSFLNSERIQEFRRLFCKGGI